MLEKLPSDYLGHEVKDKLRKMGHLQPLNIFLKQEIDRIQRVITAVRNTLIDLRLAIDGLLYFSLVLLTLKPLRTFTKCIEHSKMYTSNVLI